ncbi:PepSY domain-containing protein [Pseudoalteromonas citrea]|uniref:PepSY domain-containing protein n=1 Tax=Pseudoalteromonas citrea TaxID=43655 RepID=A0A5S3XSB8_9GAMM|nr:PepSY domain-containing protein [Pseudoalteromonas citrea]TMP61075.1 PepSY domain-containing protein [Pseudoalteromonas citrea]
MLGQAKKRKGLKKLYNLHAWVGFQLSIIMFVILATGTIATLSNEIDWLIFEELRASEKPLNASPMYTPGEWVALYSALQDAYPNGQILDLYSMGEDYLTYRATLKDTALGNEFVNIDQWTHKITGNVGYLTVQRFFRDFHRYLFMPALPGIIIVCAFAFVLLISLYTGIKTTKNWRTALWRLRLNQGSRIAVSDAHKLSGLWGMWFTLLISVTGIWYLYEFSYQLFDASIEPNGPIIERTNSENNKFNMTLEEFREIVNIAHGVHKDWEITAIYLPATTEQPIEINGVKNNPLLRDRAYRVYLDPTNNTILEVLSPDLIGINANINEYIDPLHFGSFGSIWSKAIWFLFGLMLTAMSVTGVLMTWKRTKSRALTKPQISTLPILVFSGVVFIFWIQRFA